MLRKEGVASIAAAVSTRPCLYAARRGDGAAPALRDKRVYAEVYAKSKAWACDQLRKGTTRGLVMGLEGKMWTGLARRVGVGKELKADGEDGPERQSTTTPEPTAAKRAGGAAVAAARASPGPSAAPGFCSSPNPGPSTDSGPSPNPDAGPGPSPSPSPGPSSDQDPAGPRGDTRAAEASRGAKNCLP